MSLLPTSMQPTSPPPPPPTLPPRSKCARMARVFSADQNCSGGVNIGELLVNRSALSDTARTSQLHSHFCSSQSCFNQYVNTFRACLVDVSGSRRNVTARKLVRLHAHILSNLCIHLDKFMQILIFQRGTSQKVHVVSQCQDNLLIVCNFIIIVSLFNWSSL